MAVSDYGIFHLGSFLKGDAPTAPVGMAFGVGSSAFNGSTYHLEDEVERNAITWAWSNRWAKATAVLAAGEANGSTLEEIGIGTGATLGSDMLTRDASAIGDKDASFSVTVNTTFKIERP
jgi:hypothetical protein